MALVTQQTSLDKCAHCRRNFKPGDRVNIAHIITKIGKDPKGVDGMGAFLSPDFEIAHVRCEDPGLEKGAQSQGLIIP